VKHPHAVRAALFVLNVLIVGYLTNKALREGLALREGKAT